MMRILAAAAVMFTLSVGPAFAQRAVVRGLDKITGHARDYTLTVGRPARVGPLEVVAGACDYSSLSPGSPLQPRIWVEVYDNPQVSEGQQSERQLIFLGWLWGAISGDSALDHPTFEIWAMDCRS
ncbi:MAG: DUF2155 domain-containing protein [Hyphomonadaceae bacterium]|nr:DUF2155 domain-containing protein [Hyphomonadaceae bacterium]